MAGTFMAAVELLTRKRFLVSTSIRKMAEVRDRFVWDMAQVNRCRMHQ